MSDCANSTKHSTLKHKKIEPQQKPHIGKIGNIKLLGWRGVLKSILQAPTHLYVAWAWFRICDIGFQLIERYVAWACFRICDVGFQLIDR